MIAICDRCDLGSHGKAKFVALLRGLYLPDSAARRERPVAHPNMEWTRLGPRKRQGASRITLGGSETPAIDISHCEMRDVNLVRTPMRSHRRRRAGNRARKCNAEKCQLKAKALASGRRKVSGQIPPLVAEGRMRPVIAREHKIARNARLLETTALRSR